MNNKNLIIACTILAGGLVACNGSESGTGNTSATTSSDSNMNSTEVTTNSTTSTTETAPAMPKTPLAGQDSTFVMKAAMGGMMEVQAGTLAQQNASSDRIKTYASMMVNDHTKANNELMTFASQHGMTLPTALPADMQKHMDAMQKMTGKAFDRHYMEMMLTDHRKTVADFEKEASAGSDSDLKAWASKTLPTLQMHRDSAVALNKMKM